MKNRIRIESDGTAMGTRVSLPDGTPVTGIKAVAFQPITPLGIVRVGIYIDIAQVDIFAHPLLTMECLQEAAAVYGLQLVPMALPMKN